MESNIDKMTPKDKAFWKYVWKFMIDYDIKLLANQDYVGEHEYLKVAIINLNAKIKKLEEHV